MNVVITGANRGIGLALTKACIERGDTVYALCRNSSDELNNLDARILCGVDLSNPEGLGQSVAPLDGVAIDLLINNAGVLGKESLEDWDPATIDYQFRVNALGPLLLTQCLLKNLSAGSKIGFVTSRMGSMGDNGSGGYYGYRMSKAALNAAGVSMAIDLKDRGIPVALLHPGFVQTEMVNNAGDIDTTTAAQGLLQRLDELELEHTGHFHHANGDTLPW
ncbi:SDR family oxidoreductase [Salinimonas sp. HHU 13199]|uniref:SDR family oxidoreductase n=1 Tax=Salinimonas profundi TaxID=2729140 RepID=A0ABR8LHN3_9ALTE|nr:SDR family oxidoreductase [Salinimonas profundi]MBD3584601.1 SDR family oxidoreductase [Salinimonas profundi]